MYALFKVICWIALCGKIIATPVIAFFGSLLGFVYVGGIIMYSFFNEVDYGIWCKQFEIYHKYVPKIVEFMCVYLVMIYCKQLYNEWKQNSKMVPNFTVLKGIFDAKFQG